MIREIYAITQYGEIKGVCESKDDADKLATIIDNAKVDTVPYFPAYGYMKLSTRGVDDE